ncbi:MAG: hypothetical protein L0H63_07410 [Nitrococcus sp.]|nr:hypothetical protein [Nitrococcus sp.]
MKGVTFALGLLLAILGQSSAHAERLLLNTAGHPNAEPLVVPVRGTTMEQVKQHHGRPERIFPAVGEPPITRWVYPRFVVYFERDWVIHSVQAGTRLSGKTLRRNIARNH